MKFTKILTLLSLLLVIGFIAACSPTGNVVKDTTNSNTTEQSTQNTQGAQEQTGCQYDNPVCEGGYRCVNNQCTKISSGGHTGGGGGGGSSPIIPVIFGLY